MASEETNTNWHLRQSAAYLGLLEASYPCLDQFSEVINEGVGTGVLKDQAAIPINDCIFDAGQLYQRD